MDISVFGSVVRRKVSGTLDAVVSLAMVSWVDCCLLAVSPQLVNSAIITVAIIAVVCFVFLVLFSFIVVEFTDAIEQQYLSKLLK